MVDELWAHSLNGAGMRHRLQDHLRGTAGLARQFAEAFGAADLAGYLGLVHDVGKGSCAWQKGLDAAELTGGRVGREHKLAGAWLATRAGAGPFALCVDGHHGGMRAAADLKNMLRAAPDEVVSAWRETVSRVARVVPEVDPAGSGALVPPWLPARSAEPTARDLLARMVFSALVDADFLDTEAHFRGARGIARDADMGELVVRYEGRRGELLARRRLSPADGWREEVYGQAVAAAGGPSGLYRMAAPTGSGKTLAAGAFALHHAQANGLRGVVVAVPFISITEQNADVYSAMLDLPGQPVVLEHHSGADLDDGAQPGAWWRRLAAENWDAPFVVTTTVQLFQSLFDHRPAAMRRLHRLARSVIVLDEVQALPDRLLLPVLSALRLLTERFGATVLLASATQPAYWSLEPFRGLQIRDVIPDPKPLYARFRRVRYQWRLSPRPTLAQVSGEAAGQPQVLVVVNTTADSAAVHRHLERLRPGSSGTCLHLSTRMAAQHRRDVLREIRDLLDAEAPVAVVATQLIEAGVDVDFPVVYRAWAPADSLQQAAGRANRNARLPEGTVVIFRPADGGQPAGSSYTQALNATAAHFGPGLADPDDLDELDRYYPERYRLQNLEHAGPGFDIEKYRREMDFPAVAAAFRLIEEHTVPVAVPYGDDHAQARFTEITGRLRNPDHRDTGQGRLLLRGLRPYLATIPRSLARKAETAGHAVPLAGDMLEWRGPYHHQRGIDPAELTNVQDMEVHVW